MDRVVADLGRQAALHDYSAVDPFLDALLPHLHIEFDRTQLEYQSLRLNAMHALLQAHRKIQLRNAEASQPGSGTFNDGGCTEPGKDYQPTLDERLSVPRATLRRRSGAGRSMIL